MWSGYWIKLKLVWQGAGVVICYYWIKNGFWTIDRNWLMKHNPIMQFGLFCWWWSVEEINDSLCSPKDLHCLTIEWCLAGVNSVRVGGKMTRDWGQNHVFAHALRYRHGILYTNGSSWCLNYVKIRLFSVLYHNQSDCRLKWCGVLLQTTILSWTA